MSLSALIGVLVTWGILVAGVLRTLKLAARADELAQDLWRELARLHSESGIAFFPTIEARRDLEASIAEALELDRRAA